ncbi:hypothetical protein EXD82_02040 [Peptacetobacter hominis]|uniref:YopA central domain-containing protein n=1 Tax=Peptacetobacter hominis TaxID=2743610 RepID=A0A544QWX5_9FIRM|nr:hypothetical protein [Peptacetobacter hominis]TQQ85203.1 hypothetical protein EXD82_02040 [Peptacetobacter hominis]
MKNVSDAILSPNLEYGINEDITVYDGRFCVYLDKKYRCNGKIFLKVSQPSAICFKARIVSVGKENTEPLGYDDAIIEVHGYKLASITVKRIKDGFVEGYINSDCIKSKNTYVSRLEFELLNVDKIPGKLIKHKDKLYAGRIEFEINGYVVTIDKRYDYRREFYEEMIEKSGTATTHIGTIKRKDGSVFKTNNMMGFIDRICIAFSFACGRHISFSAMRGYRDGIEVYRAWNEGIVTPFKFLPTWTDTLTNYRNYEKYMELMCRRLEDYYYGPTLKNVTDWYIDALNNITMDNDIISVQIALESLSYVVLVEKAKILTDSEFDRNSASKNIRMLLDVCSIPYGKDEMNFFSGEIREEFDDGVDLINYYRNRIVHPSKRRNKFYISAEDVWNILSIGISYIELAVLYVIGYKGEYSNRLEDRSFGKVDVVPWA